VRQPLGHVVAVALEVAHAMLEDRAILHLPLPLAPLVEEPEAARLAPPPLLRVDERPAADPTLNVPALVAATTLEA